MNKLLSLTITLLMCLPVMAQHITEEQALQKAQAFMQGKVMNNVGGRNNAPAKPRAMKRVEQAMVSDALYMFNVEDNGGFVIVSGDSRTEEILGYSTEGNIDPQQMPENMREWLKGYEEQIKAIPANATAMPAKVPIHPAIEPLLKSQWNQGAPYNLQCPEMDGSRYFTGCVATAMAQIMYYWKWPQDYTTLIPGYGYGESTWNEEKDDYDYSGYYPDLPPTQFDWEHMKDRYTGNETDASADAVAQLMHYCGKGSKMIYELGGSATHITLSAFALHHYFGYDQNIRYASRPSSMVYDHGYTHSEWDELIYGELSEGRPVLYSGNIMLSGHAFVCDGYDGGGMYHFNWGWSGSDDCYCRLSLIGPGRNKENGFSYGQNAIIGIQPPTGLPIDYAKGMYTAIYLEEISGKKMLRIAYGNCLTVPVQMENALGLIDSNGNIVLLKEFGNSEMTGIGYNGAPYFGSSIFSIDNSELALSDGTYHFVVMTKSCSETEWHIGSSLDVVIADGEMSELNPTQIEFVDIKIGGDLVVGHEQYADVTFRAIGGDCQDIFYYEITKSDEIENIEDWPLWTQIYIDSGETETVRIHFTPTESGEYHFVIGRNLGYNMETHEDGSPSIINTIYERHHADYTIVSPFNLNIEESFDWGSNKLFVCVTNIDEVAYDREVAVRIYPREDYGKDDAGQVFKSEKLHIEPGQSMDVNIDCIGLSVDNLYLADLMYYKNPNSDVMSIGRSGLRLNMVNKGRFNVNGIQYVIADLERHYVFASECTADAPTQLTIPATVVSPEDGVSYTVKGIGQNFCQYNDVTTLSFSYGITTIDTYAVRGCESLETVVLPGSLNRIGASMISQCPNLKAIYSKAHEAPLLVDYGVSNYLIGWDAQYDNITLYVPKGSRDSYAKRWTQFTNIVEMDVEAMPSTTSDDQVSDLTALVGVTAEDWHAGGMVGWAGPEVTTNDGRTTALAEVYEETTETTGMVMEQTVTGLENGRYRVTLYANACYTPNRGFDSSITDGQTDVVYLFANDAKQYIPARIAERVSEHGEYTLTSNVTDGTLHLGMVAEKPGTNWHSIQIRSLDRIGIMGDINNDGVVDVSDYIGIANFILGNPPSGFNEAAADVNNDGNIDVSDYIGVANIILTGSVYGNGK